MKHLKLFEHFSGEYFLVDQLSNSMEFYNEEEFVNNISSQTDYSEVQLRHIFKEYWKLEAQKRGDIMFDWKEWIDDTVSGLNDMT